MSMDRLGPRGIIGEHEGPKICLFSANGSRVGGVVTSDCEEAAV